MRAVFQFFFVFFPIFSVLFFSFFSVFSRNFGNTALVMIDPHTGTMIAATGTTPHTNYRIGETHLCRAVPQAL